MRKLIILMAVAALPVIFLAGQALAAKPLTVDDDLFECPDAGFTTIGGALAVAVPGNRIHVCEGVYNESVLIATDGITLKGVPGAILDGTGLGAVNGIFLDNVSGVTVHGFEIRNYGNQGVRGEFLSDLTLRKLNIHDVGNHAIDILDSNGVVIKSVTIAVGAGAPGFAEAIRLESVGAVHVNNANVTGGFIGVNFACGLCDGTELPTNGLVNGSTFTDNSFTGVLIANSTDARIRSNKFTGAGFVGISVEFLASPGIRISGNELSENFIGIFVAADSQPTLNMKIEDNYVHNNILDGIVLLNVHDSEISANVVDDNGGHGIALFDSGHITSNSVTGNAASGNGFDISFLAIIFGAVGGPPFVDMYHDPSSTPNIWSGNTCLTSSGAEVDCP